MKLKPIDHIIETNENRYCIFLIPLKSKSYLSFLMENKETKGKKLNDVLFVAREAIMENPEKFGVVCNENCESCNYFKDYSNRLNSL